MFTPFYSLLLALTMVSSSLLPTAEAVPQELSSYTDTVAEASSFSRQLDCPYHVNCPNYPDCVPTRDGSGNSQADSTTTAGLGNRYGQANGAGICAQDGSCTTDCPNYPDCVPARDGSGNQWGHHSSQGQGTSSHGHHGRGNR